MADGDFSGATQYRGFKVPQTTAVRHPATNLLSFEKQLGIFLDSLSRAMESGKAKPSMPFAVATFPQRTDKPIQASTCELHQESHGFMHVYSSNYSH